MSFWSPTHPARLRRSSLTYSRNARSARLTPRAPRRRKFAHGFLPGFFLLQVTLAAAVLASCATDAPAPPAPPLPEFQPTASVEDIMRAMVDPSADAMWDAVVTTVTEAGVEEVRPRTEEDWWALERGAIMLVEAGNLLLIDGRRIAREGSVSALPGFDLEPEEIAVRVADNRDTWMRLARELHDAGGRDARCRQSPRRRRAAGRRGQAGRRVRELPLALLVPKRRDRDHRHAVAVANDAP